MRKFILILAILCQVLPAAAAYHGITVANGAIGIMPWNEPLKVSQVILSNVYDSAGKDGVSRMVRGINPFTPVLEIDGSVPRCQQYTPPTCHGRCSVPLSRSPEKRASGMTSGRSGTWRSPG